MMRSFEERCDVSLLGGNRAGDSVPQFAAAPPYVLSRDQHARDGGWWSWGQKVLLEYRSVSTALSCYIGH